MTGTRGLAWAALVAVATAGFAADTSRRPHPFAPSLPELTSEEEDRLDAIIDRFILYDTGRLKGAEGLKARTDFEKLGPEAIPALIRGMNRAAKIQHSCPVTVIGKKLHRMLSSSSDTELLQFARDEIGAGVARGRHHALLQDLRVALMVRRNALLRAGVTPPKPIRAMTVVELSKQAERENGSRLQELLGELERRRAPEAIVELGRLAGVGEPERRKAAREALERQLYQQPVEILKEKLRDRSAEVRRAAAKLVGAKLPALLGDVIELVADPEPEVRQTARSALLLYSNGKDFGPEPDASAVQRAEAVKQWRDWYEAERRAP